MLGFVVRRIAVPQNLISSKYREEPNSEEYSKNIRCN